jgi:hypothetical protein
MPSSTKYIGMDVHQESISIAVRNAAGKIVMECVIETKASMILQFVDGLPRYLSKTGRNSQPMQSHGRRIDSLVMAEHPRRCPFGPQDGRVSSAAYICIFKAPEPKAVATQLPLPITRKLAGPLDASAFLGTNPSLEIAHLAGEHRAEERTVCRPAAHAPPTNPVVTAKSSCPCASERRPSCLI